MLKTEIVDSSKAISKFEIWTEDGADGVRYVKYNCIVEGKVAEPSRENLLAMMDIFTKGILKASYPDRVPVTSGECPLNTLQPI